MAEAIRKHRKLDDEAARTIIDQLESKATKQRVPNCRRSERYTYYVPDLQVEFPWAGGTQWHTVPTRNISREGIGFLIGQFIYPGTRFRIRLVSQYKHEQLIQAEVVRCRYIEGTASVYEVGARFEHPVDVAMFHHGAMRLRTLVADDDPLQQMLIERLMAPFNAEITGVLSGRDAVVMAMRQVFDVILMDIDMPEIDGIEAVKQLREKGYARPIVAITALQEPDVVERCLAAGCTDFVSKPVNRDALLELVRSLRLEPVVSSMVQDSTMTEVIDSFVGQLPDLIGQLEGAFGKNDGPGLSRLARRIKGVAGSCGFEVITVAAADLETGSATEKDLVKLRKQLNTLIRLCQAARPATCRDDKRDE